MYRPQVLRMCQVVPEAPGLVVLEEGDARP